MQILEKTLRFVVMAGVFFLPFICLIVASSLFFPYITGKNFAFRITVEIIAAAWLALAIVSNKYRPRRSWLLGVFAFFVFVIAIADAQGVVPFKSFWSNFERMDGWVTLIHLLLYLIVVASVVRTEELWKRLFQVSLAVSAFVSTLGLLQITGIIDLGSGGTGLSARIDATFGNPIYLAIYMLFNVFIAALLWAQEGGEHWSTRERVALPAALLFAVIIVAQQATQAGEVVSFALAYLIIVGILEVLMLLKRHNVLGFVIAIDTFALLFSGTRGTILGLIGGAALALVLYALTPDASKRLRQLTVGTIAVIVVCAGGLWVARDTSAVHSIVFLDRLASISTSDTTIASRFTNMSIAWQGVKERPIFGWGQENYAIVFDKYYDPRMYADEPWFDRVHDIVFDWWIAGGTVGLLSYLAILVVAVGLIWRSRAFSAAERAILTGLIAGYFVHNLTVFDNITSYILFATLLGYIAWRTSLGKPILFERPQLPPMALPFVAVLCAVLCWGGAWYVNADALAQNRAIISALTQQSSASVNLSLFEQAVGYGTYGTQEAREQLVQTASNLVQSSSVDTSTKTQFFQLASAQMTLQEAASPLDARFPLFLGVLNAGAGQYAAAGVDFEKAHELSPKKQTILFQLGLNDQSQGQYAAALPLFKQAYDLAPQYGDAVLFYAAAAIYDKQDALADQLLAPLIPTGQAADQRILSAYASRGLYSKLVPIWQAHVQAAPTDAQGYFTLAALYYQGNDHADAIATLQAVSTAIPSVATQAQALIQQVQNGTVTTK